MRKKFKLGSLKPGVVKTVKKIIDESKAKKQDKARVKKMGGGMMGRRMGYSQGSSKGKVPTTPKEKALAKLAPPKDKITFGDVVAGRTKGKRMQAKDGTGPEQFMRTGKEDPMRDRKKQPLKMKPTIVPRSQQLISRKKDPMRDRKKQPLKQKSDRSRKIGINTYRRKP